MSAVGLRERKKRRTREQMVDAATTLFEERGFDAVTVDEIAEAAMVSPRTFFRYFGSKEAVLFPDEQEMLQLLRTVIAEQPAGVPPLRVLRVAVSALAQYSVHERDQQLRRARLAQSGAAVQTYRRAVLQPKWEMVIANALAAHMGVKVDVDVRPRLLAGVGIAVMDAAGQQWLTSGGVEDIDALLTEAFDALGSAVDGP